MLKSILWTTAILLLSFVIRVIDASSDIFVVKVGTLNECGSSNNVVLSQITAVCSNGTNYCSEGDTVVVSVTAYYSNITSSDAYLSVTGSYGPCSWTLLQKQQIDLCLAAVGDGGKTCPEDGSYTMEAAEVKLDSGFYDYLDENVTFTFEFEDSSGDVLGCSSTSTMITLPSSSSSQDMSRWYKYGSGQEEVAVTGMKAEQTTASILQQLAPWSWVYISMLLAAVGIAVIPMYIWYSLRVQPKLDVSYDDKKVPFSQA